MLFWTVRVDQCPAEREGCMGVSAGPPGKAELGLAGTTRSFHLSGALDRELGGMAQAVSEVSSRESVVWEK